MFVNEGRLDSKNTRLNMDMLIDKKRMNLQKRNIRIWLTLLAEIITETEEVRKQRILPELFYGCVRSKRSKWKPKNIEDVCKFWWLDLNLRKWGLLLEQVVDDSLCLLIPHGNSISLGVHFCFVLWSNFGVLKRISSYSNLRKYVPLYPFVIFVL